MAPGARAIRTQFLATFEISPPQNSRFRGWGWPRADNGPRKFAVRWTGKGWQRTYLQSQCVCRCLGEAKLHASAQALVGKRPTERTRFGLAGGGTCARRQSGGVRTGNVVLYVGRSSGLRRVELGTWTSNGDDEYHQGVQSIALHPLRVSNNGRKEVHRVRRRRLFLEQED